MPVVNPDGYRYTFSANGVFFTSIQLYWIFFSFNTNFSFLKYETGSIVAQKP
jgi:hypothetical protein